MVSEGSAVTNLPKKSDLGIRTLTALVMVTVAGGALWSGGLVWQGFVTLIALGLLLEWFRLAVAFNPHIAPRLVWFAAGVIYIGFAMMALAIVRHLLGPLAVLFVGLEVIAVDIGAYFAGRSIGGPKIAPSISPSKTWAGLAGGIAAACLVAIFFRPALGYTDGSHDLDRLVFSLIGGTIVAVVAQSGDFFESWMKRRAGVKDSGRLLPGHGGLFDRLDGLLAVLFALGLLRIAFGPKGIL